MEENLKENIPLPSPDPVATTGGGGCCDSSESELTRSNSDASALTVVNSKRLSLHNANAKPGQDKEWTNEKHSLYLNSLEASFVKQLHHSMGFHGWRAQENVWGPFSSRELPANTHNSCDEFMVQRGGCWQKINFERNETLLDSTADSHVILESPWIQHFRSAGKRRTQTSPDPQDSAFCSEGIHLGGNPTLSLESARSLEQHPEYHLCPQNLVGNTTEVSDQNFVDEDRREKSSCSSLARRLKKAAADASNNDQVVPLGKFTATDVSPISYDSSEKEQVQHKLLAEQPENFVCPNSDLHYFLRGS